MSSTSELEAEFWHSCVPGDMGGGLAMVEDSEEQVVMPGKKKGKGHGGEKGR